MVWAGNRWTAPRADFTEPRRRVIPTVANPHIAGGVEGDWRNDLQTADVALGGVMGSPVFHPRGQASVRTPQSWVTEWLVELATQTLSLPSMATPMGR